ncbi:hypothetical protein DSC45_35325 [Streptomyces sp. YIM 130001]|uniref:DUF3846 domain-containing protein n=1 Tax=Streptomyces sp. YIM 130001 TaxID=2259644 RepID=UPI000E65BA9B|nr:DUF3846 domain-containing protein [Streptomyces sp. YIM 130001]RII06834.1 hypothetical protein DSC45_35325 [Streptomyces sp. YIM 130001]
MPTRTKSGFALLIRTDSLFRVLDWPASDAGHLQVIRAACDCDHFDAIRITDNLTMWLDDEGLLNGAPYNPGATLLYAQHHPLHQPYHGHALFTGGADAEGNTLGLTDHELTDLVEQHLAPTVIPRQRTGN